MCSGEMLAGEYEKQIKNIELLFLGKKKKIILNLKRLMNINAGLQDFEKANIIKKQIFALEHIRDVSLIKREIIHNPVFRIEAYDVAHHAGEGNVGVMVVLENGEIAKGEYKKFKIRGDYSADDLRSLREILGRRLDHPEWKFPDLLVVDGGKLQVAVAESILERDKLPITVVGVVKDDRHKPERILGDVHTVKKLESQILLANSEAHRFAIAYHRKIVSRIK